jgi:hypothetical protein
MIFIYYIRFRNAYVGVKFLYIVSTEFQKCCKIVRKFLPIFEAVNSNFIERQEIYHSFENDVIFFPSNSNKKP